MNKILIQKSIQASLLADAYALGAHWVYDEQTLKDLPIDWNTLNDPQVLWHKGKKAGDYTHYGDHTLWLLEYIDRYNNFDINTYAPFWYKKMQSYTGYIDGSSRETLKAMDENMQTICGSNSQDLSICGRIMPLLLVSSDQKDFLSKVDTFVQFTHNDTTVRETAGFLATILYEIVDGHYFKDGLDKALQAFPDYVKVFSDAMRSVPEDSSQSIRTFGPACGVKEGIRGALHIMLKHQNFTQAMIANAKAGGDSAARGMVVGMIFGAMDKELNTSWQTILNSIRD
jgi:ADP-ribosylglycohydrolase